jgi:hypothetical protein
MFLKPRIFLNVKISPVRSINLAAIGRLLAVRMREFIEFSTGYVEMPNAKPKILINFIGFVLHFVFECGVIRSLKSLFRACQRIVFKFNQLDDINSVVADFEWGPFYKISFNFSYLG